MAVTYGPSVWKVGLVEDGNVPQWRVVPAPERYVTNLAYGRKGNKTLYTTESETGTILAAKMEVPGKIVYSHL